MITILLETLTLGTAFIGGLLSFLSPCVLPLLPVYFSSFAQSTNETDSTNEKNRRTRIILMTLSFVTGVSTIFIIMGFGAGQFTRLINNPNFLKVMGVIVILMGIHQTGIVNLKFLNYEKKVEMHSSKRKGYLSTYLLGLTFSFGWTPCIGPILTAVLSIASTGKNTAWSLLLMAIYSLGFALPFVITSFFADSLLKKMKGLNKHLNKIKIISGILIILMGILLMNDSLYAITALFD